MGRAIDFYFSLVSPFVYIGDAVFRDLVKRHNLDVTYKPVSLMTLFANTGGQPPPQRHPNRQAIRWLELQRWRDARGIEMNLKPAHWPFASPLPDQILMVLQDRGIDPAPLHSRMMRALWVEERNLAEDETLKELLDAEGLPADEILAAAAEPKWAERHTANTEEAAKAGVFGSPSIVIDGEVFWGQDRYEHLDEMLTSGREAYRPL